MQTTISETLESSSSHRSQELYLIPRNFWLHLTSIHLKPEKIQSGQRLRVHILIPNTSRSVHSSLVLIDDDLLRNLYDKKKENGFSELPIDITAVCEYKHDIRFGHSSNLEIEVEVLSGILSRSRVIGTAIIDLASALQTPLKAEFPLYTEQGPSGALLIQIHSLCISRAIPSTNSSNAPNSPHSLEVFLSDSETEPLPTVPENTFTDTIRTRRILLVDSRNPPGQKLASLLSSFDALMAVTDIATVNMLFTALGKLTTEPSSFPNGLTLRLAIAGDDSFVASVLGAFIFVRDRGIISNDLVQFIIIPLGPGECNFIQKVLIVAPSLSRTFLSPLWISEFDIPQTNPISKINDRHISHEDVLSQINSVFTGRLAMAEFEVADVQIMTPTAQFVQPMLSKLELGDNSSDYNRGQQKQICMRACFINSEGKVKVKPIKFLHFVCLLRESSLVSLWGDNNSQMKFSAGNATPQKTKGTKKRMCARVSLTMLKMPNTINLRIDNNEIKGAVGFTISLRDGSGSIPLWGILD